MSTEEVEGLRAVLESGKRPRVMFAPSAGQMAGQLGQVVRLDDPSDGPEFVTVRFGKDELGFSPADLLVPPKKMPAPRAPEPEPEVVAEPVLAGPPLLPPAPKPTITTMETAAVEKVVAPRKPAKVKAPAELTVTLTCQEGVWSVQAARGVKVVAKPTPVRAPDALAMVALLDAPAVREAVEDLVSAARAAAEEEADRLRRQLAEVEARLAELPQS
ncbi:hypothetical protein AB0M43_08870 [Longispora sp. NPDC051575]|uniref:hypothetical protein n=1 Tax=Longispora sp. NPDC051575 TaxID=3154943 RepID=UPI00342D65A8